jgi:hypothetical protein
MGEWANARWVMVRVSERRAPCLLRRMGLMGLMRLMGQGLTGYRTAGFAHSPIRRVALNAVPR